MTQHIKLKHTPSIMENIMVSDRIEEQNISIIRTLIERLRLNSKAIRKLNALRKLDDKQVFNLTDGVPYAVKVARTVWRRGKDEDYFKVLPIPIDLLV